MTITNMIMYNTRVVMGQNRRNNKITTITTTVELTKPIRATNLQTVTVVKLYKINLVRMIFQLCELFVYILCISASFIYISNHINTFLYYLNIHIK